MENIINSIEECLSILCQKHGMSDMFLLDWESNLMDHRNNRITTLKTLNSNSYLLQPIFQHMFIFGRGFQSPLFSPMLLTPPPPPIQILPPCSFYCLLSLAERVIMSDVLLCLMILWT